MCDDVMVLAVWVLAWRGWQLGLDWIGCSCRLICVGTLPGLRILSLVRDWICDLTGLVIWGLDL
ncbi:hypothetical protein BP00DRAFT_430736 [Aspergillus indologenus CBS 114.80]|uniref:Uncharacterized protein n=1 Tax=Aspergillus indologenus CBS 114.80 TaxID=1450541 RepID=A0A2V5IPZ3_9EURO|nr:hypothetical protein BP00DRAFT_430736 [Aspergillus indologenus CBS 114.80]